MFKFTPRQIPPNIVVIGCGGTGSRLVPMLAQFVRSITREFNPRGWLESPTIYLCDDDTIEQKNLLRQNFIEADVGKFKSVVLAQRYSRAYGIKIVPSTHRISLDGVSINNGYGRGLLNDAEGGIPLRDEYRSFGTNCMYLLCVDSARARREILSVIESLTTYAMHHVSGVCAENAPFVIDAGNEDNFGQVQFFSMVIGAHRRGMANLKTMVPPMTPITGTIPAIPYPRSTYADMVDNESTASCADLDQTLAINAAMATTMLGIVQNFYYVKPFTFNRIGISLEGGNSTSFNTHADFISRLITLPTHPTLPSFSGEDSVRFWYEANQNKLHEMKLASEKASKPIEEKLEGTLPAPTKRVRKVAPGETVAAAPIMRELPTLVQIQRPAPEIALRPLSRTPEEAHSNEEDRAETEF